MAFSNPDKALCLVPCFNEAANLSPLLKELESAELLKNCDCLFVDDGSSDETAKLLRDQPYAVLRHSENLGYGASIKTGLRYAHEQGYRHLVVFPGDGQRSVADLLRLLAEIRRSPHDLVVGNKLHQPNSIPWRRAWGNRFFSWLARSLGGSPFRDVLSGFKAYRVASIEPILDSLPDRYDFDIVLSFHCGKLGLNVREIPVAVRYHAHSTKMKSEIGVGLKMLVSAIRTFYGRSGKVAVSPAAGD